MNPATPDLINLAESLDDRLSFGDFALIVGAGALGFVAVAGVALAGFYGLYRWEKRSMARNHAANMARRTGVGGALDAAADRGTR